MLAPMPIISTIRSVAGLLAIRSTFTAENGS